MNQPYGDAERIDHRRRLPSLALLEVVGPDPVRRELAAIGRGLVQRYG